MPAAEKAARRKPRVLIVFVFMVFILFSVVLSFDPGHSSVRVELLIFEGVHALLETAAGLAVAVGRAAVLSGPAGHRGRRCGDSGVVGSGDRLTLGTHRGLAGAALVVVRDWCISGDDPPEFRHDHPAVRDARRRRVVVGGRVVLGGPVRHVDRRLVPVEGLRDATFHDERRDEGQGEEEECGWCWCTWRCSR